MRLSLSAIAACRSPLGSLQPAVRFAAPSDQPDPSSPEGAPEPTDAVAPLPAPSLPDDVVDYLATFGVDLLSASTAAPVSIPGRTYADLLNDAHARGGTTFAAFISTLFMRVAWSYRLQIRGVASTRAAYATFQAEARAAAAEAAAEAAAAAAVESSDAATAEDDGGISAQDIADNIRRLFPRAPAPVLTKEVAPGHWEFVDSATQQVVGTATSPNGPDGSPMRPLTRYPVTLLREVPSHDGILPAGSTTDVEMAPGGELRILDPTYNSILASDVTEGKDFAWAPTPTPPTASRRR